MRRLLTTLALLAVLIAISLAGTVWLAGSEAGLRLAAGLVEQASAGKVAFKGLHGSLLGPMHIDAIEVRSEKQHYDAIGLELDWSPRTLWQRQLRIDRLDLAELRIVELKPDTAPPTLPDSLRLPFGLTVTRASVGRLSVKKGLVEYRLSGIELGLDNQGATYRLDLRRLALAGAQVRGRASLADARPYALSGQIRLDHGSGQATAELAGELARIRVRAAAGLAGGQASANLAIAPFTPRPLVEARIAATNIDPAAWDPALVKADIDLDASLRSEGATAYAGTVDLRNSLADAWNRGRLPLRRLSADYTGTADKMDLHALRLDLGQGGQFSGSGQVEGENLVLDLATRDFDPRGLHSQMRSLRLAGTIQLKADRSRQHLLADLNYQRYRLHLDAEQRDRVLHIGEATLSSGPGRLSLYGSLGLDATQPFDLAGALEGFDPAAFGAYPSARINASFNAVGRIAPSVEAAVNFAIADSRFRQQPLSGQGSVQVSARRLWDSRVDLRLADNRLRLDGAFGAPDDRLTFKLQADRPDLIHPALSGRISASGELAGSLAAPTGKVEIRAQDLAWGRDYRLASLQADARIDQGLAGAMALNAQLAGLELPRLNIARASAHARGRRDRHSLTLTAQGPDFDLDAELAGAWRDAAGPGESGWTGQLLRLGNRGRHPLALLAPAGLELAPDRARLTDARVAALGAQIRIDEVRYQAGAFASRGAFKGLGLASLRGLATWPAELAGDLVLAGDWRVDTGAQVDGRLSIERERGDLTVTADAPIRLGLQRLSLVAEASGNRLQASLEAEGAALGRLRARGESRLSRRDGQWGIAGDTPIQASADLTLQTLAWAAPLLDKSGALRLDGKLSAQVRADGHLAAPHYTGTISGAGLELAMPAQGVKLDQGRFEAELRQDTLELKSLSLRGGQGSLTGQGRLAMQAGQPDMQIGLKANKLTLLSSPERLLILSGDGDIALRSGRIELGGRLRADRGQFELTDQDSLSRSDDVVVLGRPPKATRALPYVIDTDLDLDLGEHFHLKWRGLDADLAGSVRLVGRRNAPLRAAGSIRVAKGTYSAYGQRLEIQRGILNFQGPLDNPGLNIQAMRKSQDVSAGVAITGSGRAPVVKLVSQPDLPDSEKLAWLVLGHGLGDAAGQDIDALQLAAGALLGMGKSVSLQQRLAQATGLEEISLKGAGTLEGSVVSLGKRLSSRAYLAYEQGLAGTSGLVKIDYTLSKRLSVRAQTGTTSAVDLFYTFSFD